MMSPEAVLITILISAMIGGVVVMFLCHHYGNPITRITHWRAAKRAHKKLMRSVQADLQLSEEAIMARMRDSSNAPTGVEGDDRWKQWRLFN